MVYINSRKLVKQMFGKDLPKRTTSAKAFVINGGRRDLRIELILDDIALSHAVAAART